MVQVQAIGPGRNLCPGSGVETTDSELLTTMTERNG